MKLNIACGTDIRKGWVNIDHNPELKPDIVCDIRKGLPFPDNAVDEIYCGHFLEHLDWTEGHAFLEECKRVMSKGASATFVVPDVYVSTDHLLAGKMPRDMFDLIASAKQDYAGHRVTFDITKLVHFLGEHFDNVEKLPHIDDGWQAVAKVTL